eukprot:TRINITY_DN27940_c0_g1_i1.p2 TRINITY_DN27940_c0_g1~~TRINITY_DN27940_c0_g1_i1.p2  ORF type:complete len:238 (-),score=22.24 TRINITY_DN27940_c0_g1_i1:1193-1906(-)
MTLNIMIETVAEKLHQDQLFDAKESDSAVTLGVQIIVVPWNHIKKKYQEKLANISEGEKVDMVFIDCEGTDYKNKEYAQIIYLISWLISSVTHVNASKVIDDDCEAAISMTCFYAHKTKVESIFSSHIIFLIRDVSISKYPEASKLFSIIEKRPKLLSSLKEFKNGYTLMPIYCPDTVKSVYITTKESEYFYTSVIDALETTLDRRPPLQDKQPWLNNVSVGLTLFGSEQKSLKPLR